MEDGSPIKAGESVGLYGGTFDPVHKGHLQVARYVLDHCAIDKVLFIPAPDPPHKRSPIASFAARVDMLRLALQKEEKVAISLVELECPSPSYSIHTVERLQEQFPKTRFSLIMGADSLVDLPQWHRYQELITMAHLIVLGRGDFASDGIDETIQELCASTIRHGKRGEGGVPDTVSIEYLSKLKWPVSSSAIREQLARGEQPEMLPPAVFSYIRSHSLYR